MSLRDRLFRESEHGNEPEFRPCALPPLVELDRIFATTSLYSLDVDKQQPADELAPHYVMTCERVARAGATPDVFTIFWDPVLAGSDPPPGSGPAWTQCSGAAALPR